MDSKTIEKNSEECEWPLGGRTLSNLELTCTSDLVWPGLTQFDLIHHPLPNLDQTRKLGPTQPPSPRWPYRLFIGPNPYLQHFRYTAFSLSTSSNKQILAEKRVIPFIILEFYYFRLFSAKTEYHPCIKLKRMSARQSVNLPFLPRNTSSTNQKSLINPCFWLADWCIPPIQPQRITKYDQKYDWMNKPFSKPKSPSMNVLNLSFFIIRDPRTEQSDLKLLQINGPWISHLVMDVINRWSDYESTLCLMMLRISSMIHCPEGNDESVWKC